MHAEASPPPRPDSGRSAALPPHLAWARRRRRPAAPPSGGLRAGRTRVLAGELWTTVYVEARLLALGGALEVDTTDGPRRLSVPGPERLDHLESRRIRLEGLGLYGVAGRGALVVELRAETAAADRMTPERWAA